MPDENQTPAGATRSHDPAVGTTAAAPGGGGEPTPSQLVGVERLCDEYEDRLRAGESPDPGEFLARAAEPVRPLLLRELVRVERAYRGADAGGRTAGYRDRFPEYAAALDDLTRTGAATGTATGDSPGSTLGDGTAAGGRFGPYALVERVAAGGMGVVYRARDTRLEREVALKMVLGGDRARPEELVRFLLEARAVAAIDHPHVVRVLEFGEHGGRPFLAMEFLTGGTLSRRVAESAPLDPRGAAGLVRKVASGVAAAHALGIVHRDLKPGNVLFDGSGEPRVTDFGLAKRGAGVDLTATRAVMGTPAYMAPEQASGGTKFVGPAADVWALGVVLYECLTGRRPFAGETTDEVLHAVVHADPPSPRELAPAVPRDLDLVVGKCLEKDARDRYPTAADLAEDLRRFVAGEPISVRPAGPVERAYKWVRRKPAVAALYAATAAAAVLLVFGGVVAWLWRGEQTARRDAESARGAALMARDALGVEKDKVEALNGELEGKNRELAEKNERIEFLNYTTSLGLALVAHRATDVTRASAFLDECPPRFRGWEWWYLHRQCNQHRSHVDAGGMADALTSDGSRLLVRTATEVRLVGAATGRVEFVLAHPRKYNDRVVLSGDGSRLAVEGPGRTVRVFDTAAGREVFAVREPVAWPAVELSPDGRRLAAIDAKDGAVGVWGPDGTPAFRLAPDRPARADRVAFSPDGKWIVTHAADARLRVWDAATGRAVADAAAPDNTRLPPQAKLVFVGAGERFAVDPGVSPVRVYDTATARELCRLVHTNKDGFGGFDTSSVMRLAGSPDGKRVATGHQGTTVQVWDAETGKRVCVCTPPEGTGLPHVLRDVTFSPDSRRVMMVDTLATPDVVRNRARVWDANTGRFIRQLPADATVSRAWYLPGGDRVLTTHLRGGVYVWDADQDGRVSVRLPDGAAVADPPLTANGRWLVGVDRAGGPLLWDVATGNPTTEPSELAAAGPVRRAAPLSHRFKAEVRDGIVYVFDPAHHPVALPGAAVGAASAAVSPDGGRVVVVEDGRARVRSVPAGEELVRFEHPSPLISAAFTRDGRHVALKPRAFEEVVCDADTGRRLFTIRDTSQMNGAERVVIGPDGRRAAVTHQPGIVRIWDTVTDRLLFDGLPIPGEVVGFTPDGRRLVIVGNGFHVIDAAPVGAPADWKP